MAAEYVPIVRIVFFIFEENKLRKKRVLVTPQPPLKDRVHHQRLPHNHQQEAPQAQVQLQRQPLLLHQLW